MTEELSITDLIDRFVKYLRNSARKQVSPESKDVLVMAEDEAQKKSSLKDQQQPAGSTFNKRRSPDPSSPSPSKKIKTPERELPSKQIPTPGSRARLKGTKLEAQDFVSAPREKKFFWREGEPAIARPPARTLRGGRAMASGEANRGELGPSGRQQGGGEPPGEHVNRLQKQPETRPISRDQLIAEVKGIYSGLVMVESRCIDVGSAQTSLQDGQDTPGLTDDQWQALKSLHWALLYEHNDFFLASQRPSTGPALRRLASKYAMTARMRHGIYSCLELLRHRLPSSSEYMLHKHHDFSLASQHPFAGPALKRLAPASGNAGDDLSIPGSVNGFPVYALPDSGADDNFISLTLARQLGANMAPREIGRVKLASGKFIEPIARVRLDWKFQDESTVYPVDFHVFKDLARPLYLGSRFLRDTQTLTARYKNRLIRAVSDGMNMGRRFFQCNFMGGQTERIGGYLDGVPTFALPDTGSSVMAVSTALAVRRGWTINTSAEHRIEVQFADGSKAFTRGLVSGLDWDFGNSDGPVREDYYVLDDLPVDVILSGNFALDRDLFSSKFADFFVQPGHTRSADRDAVFCAIRKAKSKTTPIDPVIYWRNAQVFTQEIDRREWDRQDQAEAEISKLPESEQPDRRAAEEKERQDYETWKIQQRRKASTQGNSPGTGPSLTSSSGDTGTAGKLPERTPGLVSQGTSAGGIDLRPPHAPTGLNIGFFAGVQQRLQNTRHLFRQRKPPRQPQEPGHHGNDTPLSTSGGTLAPLAAPGITFGNVSSKPSGAFARLKNKYITRVRNHLGGMGQSRWHRAGPPMQPVGPQQDTSAGGVPVPALGTSSGTPAPPAATQSSPTSSPA